LLVLLRSEIDVGDMRSAALQQDAGLSFLEYHALARLSETPGNTMRMSELAEVADAVIDPLTPAQLRQLCTASERILQRIDTSAG
jgi:hypothetical protein